MKTFTSLAVAAAILPLVHSERITLNFEDLDVSNDDNCGSVAFDSGGKTYAGMQISGASVVNSVGTKACNNPIANVDLSNKLENNVLWGKEAITFDYGACCSRDFISGPLSFDLAVDYSLLADGELDDDETKVTVELQFVDGTDVTQDGSLEYFMTKNGTGPFSITWNPDKDSQTRHTMFLINVNLWSTSLVIDSPMVAFDNIAFDHFKLDGDGNTVGGDDQTTSSVPATTAIGNITSGSGLTHTHTKAPAMTSAPFQPNITSSTSVVHTPTRTAEAPTSTSTGLAPTSGPTLFGIVAALAAGVAFL